MTERGQRVEQATTDPTVPAARTDPESAQPAPVPAVTPVAEVAGAQPTIDVAKLTPLFKLVFLTITGLTVLSFVAYMAMVLLIKEPNDAAKTFFELCGTICKMGLAAIVGLVGGKAI